MISEWYLTEMGDKTLADSVQSSPIEGEPSEALEYMQHSTQATNVLLDDPNQPAVSPEEEVDGFTDTEWEILKTQLNSSDPAVSRNALIMMTCNTREFSSSCICHM